MSELSVILVNYNVKYYLYQCLFSLRKALKGISSDIYVVDNNSRDGSMEYLTDHYPEIQYISLPHNYGFAYANNIGIRRAIDNGTRHILLLNPDTIVAENTIRASIDFLNSKPDAGALGVMMLKDDGNPAKESRRGLPDPMTAFYKMTGLCTRYPESKRFGHYYMSYLPWDAPCPIEIVSGAFLMARTDVFRQVGLLDEQFFMYGEDIDLSYRILKGGFTNYYLPEKILHYKGESTQKTTYRYVHIFYGAMLIFIRKHYAHLSFWLSIPIQLAIGIKACMALTSMAWKSIRRSLGLPLRRPSVSRPLYIFIGTEKMLRECSDIAQRNALDAQYISCTSKDKPTHAVEYLPVDTRRGVYITFDLEIFSYQEIFRMIGDLSHKDVSLGTYYADIHTVITLQDIFK